MTLIDLLPASWKSQAFWSDPIFRLLFSLIFVVGSLGHFVAHRQMLDRMSESSLAAAIVAIGNPSVLLWLSGVIFKSLTGRSRWAS